MTRYIVFNGISVFILAYLIQFHDLIPLVLSMDPTRVSFLIFGLYVFCTIYMGWKREKSNFPMIKFIGSTFTMIGLAGTIIGSMHLFYSIGASSSATMAMLFSGIAPVFITTLTGILFTIILFYQMALCFGKYSDE